MSQNKFPYASRAGSGPWSGVFACLVAAGAAHAAPDATSADKDAEALAELTRPQSRIEAGVGMISDASFAAGNYNGLDRKGATAIVSFDLRGSQYSFGNPADDKTRWHLSARNLGLRSRSISGEVGRQGAYRVTFGHDETARLYSDSYQTPFLGSGSSSLALPATFVRGADTSAMNTLEASMRAFDVQVKRQQTGIGLSYKLTSDWALQAGFRHVERDGTRLRGAEFGSNGGNPRTALLPEPIDSLTQLIDLSLAFNGDSHQFNVAYHGSLYTNRIHSLVWQNPFSSAPWTGDGNGLPAGFPLPFGQTGVTPDNQFHQLAASGSYEFSSSTRLTMTGTRGRMTQNEAFLPYTINAGLVSSALPRTSLDGLIETTFLNARLSMRPVRNLSVSASLRYEDRDNRTPQAEYTYVGGDIQLQPSPASNSDRVRTNLPRSRRQALLTLEADYRVPGVVAVKAGWEHDQLKRTFVEVEQSHENTYRLELRSAASGPWTANASVASQARRGSQYLYDFPYLSSYTSAAFINGLAAANGCIVLQDCIRTGPLQNKYYLSDRNRQRSRVMIGYVPDGALSLQARLDVNRDRYPHSPYGVTDARGWSAGADISYVFSEDISGTVFYTFEDQRSRERTRQITSANAATPISADADWTSQLIDKAASIGAGLRYRGLLGRRLELDADAIAIRGRTPISMVVGTAVLATQNPATALPDLVAHSDNVNFSARYAVDRRSQLRVSYSWRRLNSADWALQQVGVATLANVIGTLETPARFSVHGIGISYASTFR